MTQSAGRVRLLWADRPSRSGNELDNRFFTSTSAPEWSVPARGSQLLIPCSQLQSGARAQAASNAGEVVLDESLAQSLKLIGTAQQLSNPGAASVVWYFPWGMS